ncbi:MAG: helicase HerA-like domain-containing protein [Pseudomonadota bacterium]
MNDQTVAAGTPAATIDENGRIFVGRSVKPEYLDLKLANRHGLITGATGTGKTVSLQILAEGFSRAGVPVFAADIKSDLAGLAEKGTSKAPLEKRAGDIGLTGYEYQAFPVVFWDLFGEQGHPVRAQVSDMGALLLSSLLELNEVQEGILNIAFRVAAEEEMPLVDLADLRAIIMNVGERAKELQVKYGNVSKASIGAIQRRLLVLEEQGANNFFGEPALKIADIMRTDAKGQGIINILAADKLMQSPRLYSTFLLWLLSQLFEKLPEVGDPDKPKLVFFFDEAHLLFDDAPDALLDKIEQVTRLIRSKGVGVYYVTQNPLDVPDSVSSQLGNRIQHALRAFTPREQKAVRAAASTFRPNPDLDTERTIMDLGVGEALVSFLERKGEPSIVQRTLIRPPRSRLGPLTQNERMIVIENSSLYGRYEERLERHSAAEMLEERAQVAAKQAEAQAAEAEAEKQKAESGGGFLGGLFKTGGRRQSVGEAFTKSIMRSIGSAIGRTLIRMMTGRR